MLPHPPSPDKLQHRQSRDWAGRVFYGCAAAGTHLYKVETETPRLLASPVPEFRWQAAFLPTWFCFRSSAVFTRPCGPSWRATSRPARVRSMMSSLSISASLAMIWKRTGRKPFQCRCVGVGCDDIHAGLMSYVEALRRTVKGHVIPSAFTAQHLSACYLEGCLRCCKSGNMPNPRRSARWGGRYAGGQPRRFWDPPALRDVAGRIAVRRQQPALVHVDPNKAEVRELKV